MNSWVYLFVCEMLLSSPGPPIFSPHVEHTNSYSFAHLCPVTGGKTVSYFSLCWLVYVQYAVEHTVDRWDFATMSNSGKRALESVAEEMASVFEQSNSGRALFGSRHFDFAELSRSVSKCHVFRREVALFELEERRVHLHKSSEIKDCGSSGRVMYVISIQEAACLVRMAMKVDVKDKPILFGKCLEHGCGVENALMLLIRRIAIVAVEIETSCVVPIVPQRHSVWIQTGNHANFKLASKRLCSRVR